MALVVDVTHAQTTDSKSQVNICLGKGPAAALGPNIHSSLLRYLRACAKENRIPLQLNPTPGPTGTDARVIQLIRAGIPTALLAIPLRYMHSSIETVSLQDIVSCGVLLAQLIANLPENLEDVLCS
jgi:endoglucanase